MSVRDHERRLQTVEGTEDLAASTWLEAALQILERQEAPHLEGLRGGSLDRSEARKHLKAIRKIKAVLSAEKDLPKSELGYSEPTQDKLIRQMRRQDLLCPRGWREGIRTRLVDIAEASREKYLADDGPMAALADQDAVDWQELDYFIQSLDLIHARGESARVQWSKRKVA